MAPSHWLAALIGCALAACLIDVDYSGTHYRCTESPDCPPGFFCVAGYCETSDPDASVSDADLSTDGEVPPDASIDAAPPLPIGNLVTFTFDDVRWGVFPNRAGNRLVGGRQQNTQITDESKYGQALYFNGGAVLVPKDPALFPGNQITIEAWVYREHVTTQDTIYSDRNNTLTPNATYHFSLYEDAGGARFLTNDGCSAPASATSTTTVVPALVWTHVAVAWDGDRARFYMNGSLTDNLALSATPCLAPDRAFYVGRRANDAGRNPFDGVVDELKVSDWRKSRQEIIASMDFDSTALIATCGDRHLDTDEVCDIQSACCASSCAFEGDGNPCGSGTCQAGVCEVSGGRVTDGLVAFYDFLQTSGTAVLDTSGVDPALDLAIADELAVTRTAGVLTIDSATIVASPGPATKIVTAAQLTDELTLEAWVRPANTTQEGPARIVTMSFGTSQRNFQLGQELDSFQARLRSSLGDENGAPYIVSRPGDLDATLKHLVLTRSSDGVRTLYVNGVPRATNIVRGDFSNWDAGLALALANEFDGGTRAWLGEYHLIAIYNRALSAAEVGQNWTAGAD